MPPVGAAIGAIVGGIGSAVGAAFAGMTLSTFAGRLLLSVAVSALSSAMVKKPKLPGIRTENTLTGGTQAESWIIGKSATAGVAVCPAMTYGVPRTLEGSGTDNEFRVLVIDVSGIAGGPGLLRLFINDEVVELGEEEDILPGWSDGSPLPEEPLGGWFPGITWPPGTGATEPAEVEPDVSRGVKALGKYAGYLSVIWRDGTETEADPYLLRVFGQYPDRPWTADMIGRGRQICILTFKLNRELFPSSPKVGFELAGIPLYDPRLDDSVGGSGPQRWSDPATWTVSHNTAVQAYNILRGLRVGQEVWGGNASAAALPLPVFTAAMDRADAAVALAEGGSEPRYRTGLEVLAADEPASILEDLLTAANGDLAEVGGEWRIRLGEPEGPVLFVTDADIIVSKPQDYDPFPGLEQTHNAVTGTWPDPDSLWEAREAPPIHNPAWEEADGDLVWDEILPGWIRRPRRLTAALTLNACPYGQQVQRVMRAYINDERRFAAHHITLGPEASHVEPLDVIAWTSAGNGYAAKLFEVQEVAHDLMGGQVSLSIREVDPADYDWSPALEQPMPAPPAAPAEAPLLRPMTESGSYAGPFFAGAALADAEGADRRPVIIASWSPALASLATGMEWQIRLAGEAEVILHGSIQTVAAGRAEISAGILPGASYEARLTPVAPALRVQPSAWEAVTVPDVRLTADDLADGVTEDITAAVLAVAEEGWEAAQTAAETAASNAIAAQSMAVTARDQAQAAFAAADGAADEALASASDAAASAGAAGSSASAASGSASTAASHADAAGASATAAAGSATTASTQAGNASTSASQAATSATNAQGSANSAATSASVAASSRDASDDAASAAATSASSAATAATNADSRASAAQTSATNAATSAGAASTSASQAATSASNASGSANSASTSAGVAAEVRDASTRRVAAVFPSNFELDGTFWVFGHNQSATVPPTSWGPWGFRDTPAGRAVWIEGGQSGSRYIVPFGVLKPLAYQTFRVTVRARVVGPVDPMTRLRVDIVGMNADLSSAAGFSHQFFALTNDWQDLVYAYTMPATPRVIYRPRAGIDTAFPAGAQLEMVSYLVEEITSEVNAQGFATAAANSASAASASQTAAGASASAAASSATTASTGASNAATSALSASNSATSAAGSSAQALEYRNASARMTSGGVSRNPVFNDWTGTVPANTGIMLGGTTTFNKATSGVRYVNAVELVGNDVSQNRPMLRLHSLTHSLDCVPSPERILVRAEIELVSGSLNGGAALAVTWASVGGTNVNTAHLLSAFMVAETGRVQTVEVYLERPAGYVAGTNPHIVLDIYAVSNILGATRALCTLRIHRFDFEVVTANSQTEIIQRAKVAVDGIQSAVTGFRSKAGTAGAELELVALSNPNGPGGSLARISADQILLQGSVTAESAIIGNAAVDTLQIAGQAVTVPVFSSSAAVIPNDSQSTPVVIISATINREGYRTRIQFGGQIDGVPPAELFGVGGAVGVFEVLRGATVIGSNLAQVTGYMGARSSFTFVVDDPDTGTGATTYTVRMRRRNSGQADRVPQVIYPWIELMQFKR